MTALAGGSLLLNVSPARATAPPAFADDTRKMISLTRDVLNGKDYDDAKKQYDPAKIEEFQKYRQEWVNKYQFNHGKSVFGYANTWNAQAKIGFQIAVSSQEEANENYPNGFDPNSTAYNKPYLLKILDKAEKELDEFEANDAF